MAHHLLLDRAEDRVARLVLHLDPDRVAEVQERRLRLAVADGLDGAHARRRRNSRRRPRRSGVPGPPSGSLFETVPEPMIVPAPSGRVLAAWAIRAGKSKVMSSPAFGQPKGLPLTAQESGSESLAPSQAVARARPASPRPARRPRTACDWKKPKPLPSSCGMRLRSDTSLTSITSRIAAAASSRDAAHRHVAGDHRDLGLEVDAPGFGRHRDRLARTEERVGAALVHQRIGPERRRHLGAAGSADELDVVHIGRAVGPLIGARQRRGAIVLVEAEGGHRADARAARARSARRGPWRSQSSRAACSVGATKKASVARVRSLETTTSRPSRPCLRVASFMTLS